VDAVTSIAGIVTYRQRIALPAGSVVRVRLEDLSRADAPAVALAESEVVTTGEQVPIPFALEPGEVVLEPQGRRYALRAAIEVDGELRFATATRHRFERDGPAEGIELVVEPVTPRPPALGDARWTLSELGGSSVATGPGEGVPFLDFDIEELRVSGSGGCNRLTGSFDAIGRELRFGPLATTLMACPEPVMQREAAFLAALAKTTGVELEDDRLVLLGDDGVLARLDSTIRPSEEDDA
jgi:putative lipoprotein